MITSTAQRGFTLLELLLAVSVLVVITSIVYAIFASVTRSIDASEAAVEELRLRQFLSRSFETNFAAAYSDRQYQDPLFRFIGEPGDAFEGARDSVRFCATAPLIGGMAMPGDIKEVRYQVLDERGSTMTLSWDDTDPERDSPSLQVTETPLLAGKVTEISEENNLFVPDDSYESPSWAVPIEAFRIDYYDGADWVRQWDSHEIGRLPWSVRVRINFARSEDDPARNDRYGVTEAPDFEAIIPIPAGLRVEQDIRLGEDAFEGVVPEQTPEGISEEDIPGGFQPQQLQQPRQSGRTSAFIAPGRQ